MGGKNVPRAVTIINRNYPPIWGITGESARELCQYLFEQHNIAITVVHVNGTYNGRTSKKNTIGNIYTVPCLYSGKTKILRLFSNLLEGFLLVRKAVKVNKGTIICMTDPPLLSFWMALKSRERKIPWMLWAMDLFPDAFVSNGLVSRQNIFYKYFKKIIRQSPPEHVIALGKLQAKYIAENYTPVKRFSILPCGVHQNNYKKHQKPNWRKEDNKIYFGYCGNIGEAHSIEFVKCLIKNLNPQKHQFILSVYGSKSAELIKYAQNFDHVEIVNNVSRNDLIYIDIQLVSLLKKWTHVCVPSKAISAVCSSASFLFYGIPFCDNWQMLKNAGWLIDENRELEEQILNFLSTLSLKMLDEKKENALLISRQLQNRRNRCYLEIAQTILQENKTVVKRNLQYSTAKDK